MKRLIDYIKEEMSTPMNTLGMGNPVPATLDTIGTEPLVTETPKARRKRLRDEKNKNKDNENTFKRR